VDWTDEDGLPASDVGIWTLEKHARLRKYVDSAHGARRAFANRTTYIDLYCGPGRSVVRETKQFVDGSPLVAWEAGEQHGDQFAEFLLSDTVEENLDAARKRLEAKGAKVSTFHGEAVAVVNSVVGRLDPRGLHLALLDPYNLGALPFAVIEKLARVPHMDLIIHVSVADLVRNLDRYTGERGPRHLDTFAPGWQSAVDLSKKQKPENVRRAIFGHWLGLIKALGSSPSEFIEGVENTKHVDLYWLVFVSRHPLAHKLWADICNVSVQGRLPL
jgi:three-Cys-motif partner protein